MTDDHRSSPRATGHRLARLRRAEGMSIDALAAEIGVSVAELARWEDGAEIPDPHRGPIARRFGVSAGWLAGTEELPSERRPSNRHARARFTPPEPPRPNRLARLCNAEGMTLEELAAELDVSPREVIEWEMAEIPPEHRAPLARRFGVTVNWLMGSENLPSSIVRRNPAD